MASHSEPRLAGAAEIAAEQGLTSARISGLYTERAENSLGKTFPDPVDMRGRSRLWDHAEVTQWFAHRTPARLRGYKPPARDPEELLNAADASRFLGYKNLNQVTTFVRDRPGYFPEPDVVDEMGTAENPYRRQMWRVQTLLNWLETRPGRGRRAGTKAVAPLPDVPVDGDPDELLGASEAAALLGYKSIQSFSSLLSQGKLPLLETVDAVAENAGRQNGRRRWTRRRILEQAGQRNSRDDPKGERIPAHRPMNATAGDGGWSLAGRVSHDGRHGVVRHHAPQRQMSLRTGHRLSSDRPDHGPDHEVVLGS